MREKIKKNSKYLYLKFHPKNNKVLTKLSCKASMSPTNMSIMEIFA